MNPTIENLQGILRELHDEDRLTCINLSSEFPDGICQCVGCRAVDLMNKAPAQPAGEGVALHEADITKGKCAQCSTGLHRQFARPKRIEGVLRSVCPNCVEKQITHKCVGRTTHYFSGGDAISILCCDCGAEVVGLAPAPRTGADTEGEGNNL